MTSTSLSRVCYFAVAPQPSADVFKLFDTLLLLSKGRVIYFGEVAGATAYFQSTPSSYNLQAYTNPADFLVDVSGGHVNAIQVPNRTIADD